MAKKDVLQRGVKVALQFLKTANLHFWANILCVFYHLGLASVLCDNVDENILNMHQVNNRIADFHQNLTLAKCIHILPAVWRRGGQLKIE